MTISHEALYQWIYALPKGELAKSGIILRTNREKRKPRGRPRTKGSKIIGMRSIEDRPAEVAGRQVPGHWEGDLIIGKNCASAAATLVERVSRFTQIIALPKGRGSDEVCDALIDHAGDLPSSLIKSITGIRELKWPGIPLLPWQRRSTSTLPMRIPRGSAERTRTRTG